MGLNLVRADVALDTGVSYSRVKAVISAGVIRLWDTNGNLLESGEVSLHEQVGLRQHTIHLTDGGSWEVIEVRGCGCGG